MAAPTRESGRGQLCLDSHTLGTHPHTRVGRCVWADMQPTKGLLHGPNQRPQSLSGPKRMNATATAGKKKGRGNGRARGDGGARGGRREGRQFKPTAEWPARKAVLKREQRTRRRARDGRRLRAPGYRLGWRGGSGSGCCARSLDGWEVVALGTGKQVATNEQKAGRAAGRRRASTRRGCGLDRLWPRAGAGNGEEEVCVCVMSKGGGGDITICCALRSWNYV